MTPPRPMDPVESRWREPVDEADPTDVPDPIEDQWIDADLEDRLSHYDADSDMYAGTDNSDLSFCSDGPDDDFYQEWGATDG